MPGKKTPFILAGCGCASFILSMILFGAAFWFSHHHKSAGDMVTYHNTRDGRSGPLAENYAGFELQYPSSWHRKPDEPDGPNFLSVDHTVDGKTWEGINVGYFQTAGSREGNELLYPQLIAQIQSQFAGQFQGLRKVSEGKTAIGSYEGYEGVFAASAGELEVYFRAIILPTPDAKKGVALLLTGTTASPELKTAEDLGKKGELPEVLASFHFE